MSLMRIDADVVAQLGVSLAEVADALASTGDGSVDRWALGAGDSSDAFDHLLAGWRRQRTVLAQALDDLGRKAQVAGGGYLHTEAQTRRMVGGELP